MDIQLIFILQFALSILVVGLLVRWYAVPWLSEKSFYVVLMILLVPHAFRHVGMSFLVPALNQPDMPANFSTAAAYGDLLSGLLALMALIALKNRWMIAIPLVWTFSIVGTVDLINALRQDGAILYIGATWFIPTFVVPVLLVTHVMIWAQLIKHTRNESIISSSESSLR